MQYSKFSTGSPIAEICQNSSADSDEFLATLPIALAYLVRESKKFGLQETAHFLTVARMTIPRGGRLN